MRFQQNVPFGQPPPGMPPFVGGLPPPMPGMMPPSLEQQQQQISALQSRIATITEQLQQSEKNLKAQEEFLNTKKKVSQHLLRFITIITAKIKLFLKIKESSRRFAQNKND